MARAPKSTAEREQELLNTIADAKKKLEKLQQKQKIDIGVLACKHGLNQFKTAILGEAFKKLAENLKNAH
jgi:hypothetical protein